MKFPKRVGPEDSFRSGKQGSQDSLRLGKQGSSAMLASAQRKPVSHVSRKDPTMIHDGHDFEGGHETAPSSSSFAANSCIGHHGFPLKAVPNNYSGHPYKKALFKVITGGNSAGGRGRDCDFSQKKVKVSKKSFLDHAFVFEDLQQENNTNKDCCEKRLWKELCISNNTDSFVSSKNESTEEGTAENVLRCTSEGQPREDIPHQWFIDSEGNFFQQKNSSSSVIPSSKKETTAKEEVPSKNSLEVNNNTKNSSYEQNPQHILKLKIMNSDQNEFENFWYNIYDREEDHEENLDTSSNPSSNNACEDREDHPSSNNRRSRRRSSYPVAKNSNTRSRFRRRIILDFISQENQKTPKNRPSSPPVEVIIDERSVVTEDHNDGPSKKRENNNNAINIVGEEDSHSSQHCNKEIFWMNREYVAKFKNAEIVENNLFQQQKKQQKKKLFSREKSSLFSKSPEFSREKSFLQRENSCPPVAELLSRRQRLKLKKEIEELDSKLIRTQNSDEKSFPPEITFQEEGISSSLRADSSCQDVVTRNFSTCEDVVIEVDIDNELEITTSRRNQQAKKDPRFRKAISEQDFFESHIVESKNLNSKEEEEKAYMKSSSKPQEEEEVSERVPSFFSSEEEFVSVISNKSICNFSSSDEIIDPLNNIISSQDMMREFVPSENLVKKTQHETTFAKEDQHNMKRPSQKKTLLKEGEHNMKRPSQKGPRISRTKVVSSNDSLEESKTPKGGPSKSNSAFFGPKKARLSCQRRSVAPSSRKSLANNTTESMMLNFNMRLAGDLNRGGLDTTIFEQTIDPSKRRTVVPPGRNSTMRSPSVKNVPASRNMSVKAGASGVNRENSCVNRDHSKVKHETTTGGKVKHEDAQIAPDPVVNAKSIGGRNSEHFTQFATANSLALRDRIANFLRGSIRRFSTASNIGPMTKSMTKKNNLPASPSVLASQGIFTSNAIPATEDQQQPPHSSPPTEDQQHSLDAAAAAEAKSIIILPKRPSGRPSDRPNEYRDKTLDFDTFF